MLHAEIGSQPASQSNPNQQKPHAVIVSQPAIQNIYRRPPRKNKQWQQKSSLGNHACVRTSRHSF